MKFTKDLVGKDTMAKVNKVADQIKAGKLKVPATPADLTAYLSKLSTASKPSK
jgi:hypothetical protein